MKNKIKKYSIKAVGMLSVFLCANFLSACKEQNMADIFNEKENVAVDNLLENLEVVDNFPDNLETEEVLDGDSTDVVEESTSDNMNVEEIELPTEQIYTAPEILIIMVGDMLMHTPVEKSALQEDGTYSYDTIFANTVNEIQAADLAIVNQEVIIAGESLGVSGYPAFNAPFALGHDLIEAGFDVICHGTNHALDKGKKGLKSCLAFWEENYPEIPILGINDSKEMQEEIYVYEQDGLRIAVLNFTYGTNGIALPSDMPYAVDLLKEDDVVAAIVKAEEIADFTIVCPHWGTEYVLKQTKEQEKWAKIFFEKGVDLVIGTHPHVIEPIEMLIDEETGHSMLVYYSIGNFVNWTSSSGSGIANRMVGGMAQITVGMDETGKAIILNYGVEPVVAHLTEGTNGVTTYFLKDYTNALASENEIRKQDEKFSLEYCEELCDKVWGGLWRE